VCKEEQWEIAIVRNNAVNMWHKEYVERASEHKPYLFILTPDLG
jgi:hypothetical protein